MNGLIHKVVNQRGTHHDLSQIVKEYSKIGPVPALALLASFSKKLSPTEKHIIECLTPNLVDAVSLMPPNLAMRTFNTLSYLARPEARRTLSLIQDKWFDTWHPAAVEKSTKRPKKKLAVVGIYDPEALDNLTHPHALAALSETILRESLTYLNAIEQYEYLSPIIHAIRKEAILRDNRTEISKIISSS